MLCGCTCVFTPATEDSRFTPAEEVCGTGAQDNVHALLAAAAATAATAAVAAAAVAAVAAAAPAAIAAIAICTAAAAAAVLLLGHAAVAVVATAMSCLCHAACHAACHAVCRGVSRTRILWFIRLMQANARACDVRDIVGVFIGFERVCTHMHSQICDGGFNSRE